MKRSITFSFFICSLLLNVKANAQTDPRIVRFDSLFRYFDSNKLFNGTVILLEKGKLIYNRSAGFAVMENKTPNTDTTLVNVASVSKIFTAIAILQLREKKKLDLEDPVARFLPGFPYPGVKIRHLLSHTAGITRLEDFEKAYIEANPREILTNEKVYQHLLERKDTLQTVPGSKFVYNNLNYVLLAMIVEKVSKRPFNEYMRKKVFEPSGMKKTYVRHPLQPNTPRYMIPALYRQDYVHVDSLHPLIYSTYYHLGGLQGPGNIVTTAQDLVDFDKALTAGKLLSRESLQRAIQPGVLNDGSLLTLGNSKRFYGMGWNITHDQRGDTNVFHDGSIPGVVAIYLRNLSENQVLIYYENAATPSFPQKVSAFLSILNNATPGQILKTGNKKSVAKEYVKVLMEKGPDLAALSLMELRADTANYFLNELELNSLGYDLHFKGDFKGHNDMALEVMKLITILYNSANSYDSYGDVLMNTGRREEAIRAYKRSLLLNPGNQNAIKNLAKLQSGD